tara:strand:+ start:13881 stop:14450 length:570 start_codon:yes stop_codon:yes gene_type:complete
MELPKEIKDEIWEYCRVNEITNINEFTLKMVKNGFTSEKFGSTPWDKPAEIKEVEKIVEVEKEVIKEVPIEVIKEIEKIIEKEVFVTDDEANKELQKELAEVRETLKLNISSFDEDRKSFGLIDKERVEEISKLEKELKEKDKTIENLSKELEIEKNKPKVENEDDIYGGKRGYLGSNTSDLWNNKKQD